MTVPSRAQAESWTRLTVGEIAASGTREQFHALLRRIQPHRDVLHLAYPDLEADVRMAAGTQHTRLRLQDASQARQQGVAA